jgi:hypothetical protein
LRNVSSLSIVSLQASNTMNVIFDSDNLTKCGCGSDTLTIEQYSPIQYWIRELVIVKCPKCHRRSAGMYWHNITEDWNVITNS